MSRDTQFKPNKSTSQTPGDERTLTIAVWMLGGFILVLAIIFGLATGHF